MTPEPVTAEDIAVLRSTYSAKDIEFVRTFWTPDMPGRDLANRLADEIERLNAVAAGGDAVEAWLKTKRDEYQKHATSWYALDSLLNDYRLHADYGTPLSEETPESSGTAYGIDEPTSTAPSDTTGHVAVTCNNPECNGCNFCAGGLWACDVCNGAEGSMPSTCPGKRMTADESDAVYAGHLDFRDGNWISAASKFAPGSVQ